MNAKETARRALSAYVSIRALEFVSLLVGGVLALVFVVVWIIAVRIDEIAWFWMVPVAVLGALVLVSRTVLGYLIGRLYRHPFSAKQRSALAEYTHSLEPAAIAQHDTLPRFAVLTLSELVWYRETRSLGRLISATPDTRRGMADVEKYFSA